MLVRDDWDKVKVGDRVRFTSGGGDAFEGTVTKRGRKLGSYGSIEGAAFDDNVTYKLDGTPRKNSAKVRRDQILKGNRVFEIVEARTYPTTVAELTDEHIGMRFKFIGAPTIEGVYAGPCLPKPDNKTSVHIYVDGTDGPWGSDDSYGYYIRRDDKIEYISGGETQPQEGVDIDAKLAAYFNQELDKAMKTSPGSHAGARNKGYGYHIVAIMKTLTE